MAEARLRYGTESSADVKLFLTGPNEEKYGRNPVHLHSQILKRSKFFGAKFSNHRSSDKPTEILVTTAHNFDHYLKCIEIMYGERVDFPNIEECLAILSVASEMSADNCINKCFQYLEAVRWTAEQESQIRNIVSCEGLKLFPDLAARLHQDDDKHMIFVEKSIQEMVLLIKGRDSKIWRNRENVEKYLEEMLDRNTSRDVVDICGRVLLQEFKASIDSRDFSSQARLFKLLQHCDGGILEAALKAFCEDAKFTEYVKDWGLGAELVFDIIMGFMKATGDGKIVLSKASRVSFLTTWLPIMGTLSRRFKCENFEQFDKAVLNVVESLPPVDKKRICVQWAEVYRLNTIDIATPLNLSEHLQHAHSKSAAK